jgi:hypothetical protein
MKPLVSSVATPALDRKLISLDDLREQLRLKPGDTANDSWLTKVIERTSRQAERYCNRIFVQQGYIDTFAGGVSIDTGAPLRLSQAPVDITTFVIAVDEAGLEGGSYSLDAFAGLVYRAGDATQWTSTASLVAQYTGGFDTIPDDVQQAVLELCVMENSGRGRDPMLRAKESPGLGREEFWVGGLPGGLGIPQDIAALLNPYRRGLVA